VQELERQLAEYKKRAHCTHRLTPHTGELTCARCGIELQVIGQHIFPVLLTE
jgi:hypothetical protein